MQPPFPNYSQPGSPQPVAFPSHPLPPPPTAPPAKRSYMAPLLVTILGPLGGFGVAVVLAVLAMTMSRSYWRLFKDGGWFNWGVVAMALLGLVLLIAVGVAAVYKRVVPSSLVVIPPALVMLVALLGMKANMSKVRWALGGESVDPAQKARIFAEGFSESLSLIVYGGALTAILFGAASVVMSGRALSRVQQLKFGMAPILAAVGGLLVLLIAAVLRFFLARSVAPVGWPVALAGVLAVSVAGCALAGHDDDSTARPRAAGDLFVAFLLAATGVLIAGVASRATILSQVFGAVSGYSIDPSQRLRIMAEGWKESGAALPWAALNIAPLLVAALLPFALHANCALRSPRFAWGGSLAAVLTGALFVFLPGLNMNSSIAELATLWKVDLPANLTFVSVSDPARSSGGFSSPLYVTREVVTYGPHFSEPIAKLDSEEECAKIASQISLVRGGGSSFALAPDESTPYRRLACVLKAFRNQVPKSSYSPRRDVDWVVQIKSTSSAPLPPPFDSNQPVFWSLRTEIDTSPLKDTKAKHLLHLSKDAWLLGTTKIEPERKQGSPEELITWAKSAVSYGSVRICVDPDLPASTWIPAAIALSSAAVSFGPALTAEQFNAELTERRTSDSADSSLSVTGRLAPEVIQRVVRAANPKLKACYDAGLKRDPKLAGKMSVRFVIGRDGAVLYVSDTKSELTDADVRTCVRNVFKSLVFPKPEGGIVTVLYPINFQTQ